MPCSLCDSPRSTKVTCPLNPDATNPDISKHPKAKKTIEARRREENQRETDRRIAAMQYSERKRTLQQEKQNLEAQKLADLYNGDIRNYYKYQAEKQRYKDLAEEHRRNGEDYFTYF
jgi:hypothetical protein